MSSDFLKCTDGYKELAGRMILRAIQDLSHPEHCAEALAWFYEKEAGLTFKQCARMLGFDEDVLRQSILQKTSSI